MNSNDNIIGPINLGSQKEISISSLANIIIELTKSNSKIVYKKLPTDDPKRRKPCIKKADKVLNWNPDFDLKKGLLKTINYFKQ